MGSIDQAIKMQNNSFSACGENVHYLNVKSSVESTKQLIYSEKSDSIMSMENRVTRLEVNADHSARILDEIKRSQESNFRWILGILIPSIIAIIFGMYSSYQNIVNLVMSLKR